MKCRNGFELSLAYLNVIPIGQEKRYHGVLRWVSVDADVIDHGNNLEVGFNLSQGNVFACLQLDEVLLPIDYLYSATLQNLSNVSGLLHARDKKKIIA